MNGAALHALPTDVLKRADSSVGDGVIRHLSLNRPAQRNALNSELLKALISELQGIEAEQRVRAVLLTGVGPGFCAGGDVKEFLDVENPRLSMSRRAALLVEVLRRLANLAVPTMAIGSGAALGAGAALLLACDVVIGVRDLQLGFPEIRDSVIPAVVMGAVVDRVPQRAALEMFTTGRRIGVEEALRLGMVTFVTETSERALASATPVLNGWASVDTKVLRRTKDLFGELRHLSRDQALERGLEVTAATWRRDRGDDLGDRRQTLNG